MSVLVGKPAPFFNAKAVKGAEIIEDFNLNQYLGEKYVVLFFYPKDFTFVCPTELISFQNRLAEFESRNTAVVGCSTDSEFSHWAWLQTPQKKGGIEGVNYPIVADINKTISEDYDVLASEYMEDEDGDVYLEGEMVAYRGLFLIDTDGIVRHQVVNDMPLGRSVDEILRVIDALQHFEEHGEVCPMDWHKGDVAMTASHDGVAEYLSK